MIEKLKDRLMAKMEISPLGCWEWKGSMINSGYGRICYRREGEPSPGRYRTTHRASWEAFKGSIPHGLSVLHRCDNPVCINPDHLFLGTTKDNMRDMFSKGRWRCGPTRPARQGIKHPMARLTNEQIANIRSRSKETRKSLADEFGMSAAYISQIINGKKRIYG